MTEETKDTAELDAAADAFVEETIKNMPEMLTTRHMMRVVGEMVTAFHNDEGDAMAFLNLCARAIAAYYCFSDDAATTDKNIH